MMHNTKEKCLPSLLLELLRRTATGFLHSRHIVPASNIDGLTLRQSSRVVANVKCLPADHSVDLGEHLGEGILHVQGLKRRGLHEECVLLLSEGLGILCGDCPQVTEIGLVPHQHDHDVGVGVISKLLQPSFHVLKGYMPSDIIDKESTHSASIIGTRDSTVPLGRKGQEKPSARQ